jgi:carbamoyl-phosphate synthase large subunit
VVDVIVAGSGNVTGHNVVKALCPTWNVVGYDKCESNANPANAMCFNHRAPAAADSEYTDFIKYMMVTYRPKAIIPSNDHDLRALIELRSMLRNFGCVLNGFGKHTIDFLDKRITSELFTQHGISTPELLRHGSPFPYVIRKRHVGTGQKFVRIIKGLPTNITCEEANNGIFTRYVEGKEFTIDVLCDQSSQVLSIVPRLRHEVRNGMVHLGEIIKDDYIIMQCAKIASAMQLKGVNCIQCIRTDSDAMFFEVNPRPGSGLSLTTAAGVNMPDLWMHSLMDTHVNVNTPVWGLKMVRYYEGHYFT